VGYRPWRPQDRGRIERVRRLIPAPLERTGVPVEPPSAPLPGPVTVTDFYLAAILSELRAQRLSKPPTPEGAVELREPKRRKS
jgi:hypothetical protein